MQNNAHMAIVVLFQAVEKLQGPRFERLPLRLDDNANLAVLHRRAADRLRERLAREATADGSDPIRPKSIGRRERR